MIAEIQYSKDFISKTGYEPAGNHGHPPESFYQQISDDEQNLREEIVKKFALNSEIHSSYYGRKGTAEGEGFDGKLQYKFEFSTTLKTPDNPEKNISYESLVAIKKAGKEELLSDLCDLECFLLENKFKLKPM